MADAQYTINGNPSPHLGTSTQAITLDLVDKRGIKAVTWTVFGSWDYSETADPVITKTGNPSGVTATLTLPTISDGYGYALGIRCEVQDAGGVTSTSTGGIYIQNYIGLYPVFPNETLEFDPINGWSARYNVALGVVPPPSPLVPLMRELTVSRELTTADVGYRLYTNSSSDIVLTIPEGILLPGYRIDLAQLGTGQLSLAAKDGNITVRVKSGKGLKLDGQYSHASLIGDEDGDPDLLTLIGEVVS